MNWYFRRIDTFQIVLETKESPRAAAAALEIVKDRLKVFLDLSRNFNAGETIMAESEDIEVEEVPQEVKISLTYICILYILYIIYTFVFVRLEGDLPS